MRTGLVASVIGHTVILLWGLIAFPSAKPFSVEPIDALPVDLVPIEEVTKTKVGEKTASIENESAPEPSKKPTEAKTNAETPGKKPVEAAKPAPAPQEPRKVAATPPTPAAEPDPQPDPEPAKEPEPAPQAEPVPSEEPTPQEAEKAPEPPKPVDVVPQSKPTPPKRTQTAAAQPTPTQRTPDEPKKDFDPNEISNLLNKVEPKGGQQVAATEPAGLGTDRATQEKGLSASDLDLLISKIKGRWNYIPDTFPSDLVVVVQFELTRDGHLAGTPQIMNNHPYPRFRQLAEAAVRAIIAVDRSEGFGFLPRDRYDGNGGWNTVLANLKPQ